MKNIVSYELLLEEPVKMGKQGNQTHAMTMSYLAGSSIRGSMLAKYIEKNCPGKKNLDQDPEFSDILFQSTYFSDATIKQSGKALLPIPMVYYADKHEIRKADREEEAGKVASFDLHCCIDEVPKEGEVRIGREGYCALDGDDLMQGKVRTDANIHISIGKEKEQGKEKNKVFLYEAICAGQTFAGTIRCRDEATAEKYAAAICNETIYVGGSRGSGFGRCKVISVQMIDASEMQNQCPIKRKNVPGTLSMFAVSNLILLNADGEECGAMDQGFLSFLEEKLGITNLKHKKSFVDVFRVSGYNHNWKCWQVQRSAVKAGSVFVYSYEGTINEEALNSLEVNGVGERRQEGFGRVLFNLDLKKKKLLKYQEKKTHQRLPMDADQAAALKVLELIQDSVNGKRSQTIRDYGAMAVMEKSQKGMEKLSKTQKSRLYNLLVDVLDERLYTTDDDAKRRLDQFIAEDIKSQTRNAFKFIAKMRLGKGEVTLEEAIKMVIDDKVPLSAFNDKVKNLQEVHFEGALWKKTSVFRQKCEFLRDVVYLLVRKEGGRA